MQKVIFFIFFLLCILARPNTSAGQSDVLDWPSFRSLLRTQHPTARQAELLPRSAAAALLRARGGFDVKAYADYSAKEFDNKTYFSYTEAGLSLPTWLGLELKANYNRADGSYINPDRRTPDPGQAAFGLNWTLGQGLFIDERRADLFISRIGLLQNAAERDLILNDLLLDGAKTYWGWVAAQAQLSVLESALTQARLRHEALRESFFQGERAGIDTVETFIQVQSREMDVYLAGLEIRNQSLEMRNFLWQNDGNALQPVTILPAPPLLASGNFNEIDSLFVQQLRVEAIVNHPAVRYYSSKLDILDVERRLKLEKRKPILNINYNFLGHGWEFFNVSDNNNRPAVLTNNIKWGIYFNYPLQNRKARGDYQLTQLKLVQTELDVRFKRQEIELKIKQYANELQTLSRQIKLGNEQLQRYRLLLDGEIERFNLGESTVFLINTREQRWLDAQIKYLKLLSEYRKAEAALLWAAGRL